jgi:hypothetical protein
VYVDHRADTGTPFYVGKGLNGRVKYEKRNRRHTHTVRKHGLTREIVIATTVHDIALAEEIRLIAELKTRDVLGGANFTDGGEGTLGWIPTAVTRLRISRSNKGRETSDKERARRSLASQGKNNPNYGNLTAARVQVTCMQCGVVRTMRTSKASPFCSRRCSALYSAVRQRGENNTNFKPKFPVCCPICNVTYYVTQVVIDNGYKKTCSKKCGYKLLSIRTTEQHRRKRGRKLSDNTPELSVTANDPRISPELLAKLQLLPTGKRHVSFSEKRDWESCTYRHKLKYVLKVGADDPSTNMDFGTAVHAACEHFLRTKQMDAKVFLRMLHELWKERAEAGFEGYTVESFEQFAAEGKAILADVPKWLDDAFPGWSFIDAEHFLYEPLASHPHAFKGYIDAIIRAPNPKGKQLVWLIDFKTTGWGWDARKKGNPEVCSQLVLYKNFWCGKTGTDPKDVRCGFVLLKRSAKPGKHCELVPTSAGEVTTGRALKVINNMVSSVKKGVALKNRNSCTYCQYRGTEHCT